MIRIAAHAFMGSKVRGSLRPTLFAISQITNQSTVTGMPPKVGLLVSSGRSTAYAAGLRSGDARSLLVGQHPPRPNSALDGRGREDPDLTVVAADDGTTVPLEASARHQLLNRDVLPDEHGVIAVARSPTRVVSRLAEGTVAI